MSHGDNQLRVEVLLYVYMKSLFQSRTFWFAVIKFLVGALALFTATFGMWIPTEVAGAILMLTSLGDMVLRLNTTQGIAGVIPTGTP